MEIHGAARHALATGRRRERLPLRGEWVPWCRHRKEAVGSRPGTAPSRGAAALEAWNPGVRLSPRPDAAAW